jgi:uncharacterized protein DUF3471
VGVYELTPTSSIAITLENGQLMEQTTDQPKFPLFPESRNKFFMKVVDVQFQFFTGGNGQVSHLVRHQNDQDMRGEKKR